MNELEKYFLKVYDKLRDGVYSIETLDQCDPDMRHNSFIYISYLHDAKDINVDALYAFVVIQLDYYTFSNIGDVFISDSDYDFAANVLKSHGIKIPTTNTFSPQTKTWQLIKHTAPQMVGSVKKVFDTQSVHEFISKNVQGLFGETIIKVAPKYDGVGVNIEYDPKTLDFVSALTRKDALYGQELIKLIKRCDNYADEVMKASEIFGSSHGYIKCELVMSQDNFDKLIKEKTEKGEKIYKNRRNGTSGIINTPTNIDYAKYLTIKHLAYGIEKSRKKFSYLYDPEGCLDIYLEDYLKNPTILDKAISRILDTTHISDFEYRTDGVVIFISNIHIRYENIMDHAVAFKTNSKVGVTRIKYGYISIGRTGKATPMIKVEPCDVNETMVTDVNLSNFAKVKKLGLHEGDTIAIESSGDVIPMIKEIVMQGSPTPLGFDLHCPMCGKKLYGEENAKTKVIEYRCINDNCPALSTGVITNFFDKLGANGISDTLILSIYEKLGLNSIADFLDTNSYKSKLIELPGWGVVSATNFTNEIDRIKDKPITNGEFVGALGIPLISTKKCRTIFSTIKYDKFVSKIEKGKYSSADEMLYSVKGMATKSVDTIMDYFKKNYDDIELIRSYFTHITNDILIDANVVFSGFRDSDTEEYLIKHGIDVSETITSKTIALITANRNSTKTKKAESMNIPVYDAYNLSEALRRIIESREIS